ncbi:MAG: serine acetyltransferase [Deltaproteobacteria bacterium]|nr:MAG: serine acetyltransferase [Deltaproteobacteria bacterium]
MHEQASSGPLDEILDALVDSYHTELSINNLETSALPNRRAVIEAFGHLQHLIFLGYFTTRDVGPSSLRPALREHLVPGAALMTEQIHRAIRYADRALPLGERRTLDWSRELVERLLLRLPELRRRLDEDVRAAWAHDPAAESLEEVVFSYPGVLAITAYRVAHALHGLRVPMIPRILTEHAHGCTGIDLHPGAEIGRRFFIDHGTGVVVGATTHIGDDVKLYQGVTLGAMSVKVDPEEDRLHPVKRHPTLQDRVTVYAGATILGGQTVVGHDSVIGGNVWLTRSVPPRSRILSRVDQGTG